MPTHVCITTHIHTHTHTLTAQSLFRTKGRGPATEQDAVYQAEMQLVVAELKVRFQRIEAERKEAAAQALQRSQQERLLKSMKRRDLFQQLLRGVFDKWTASMWRTQPAYIYLKEWVGMGRSCVRFPPSHSRLASRCPLDSIHALQSNPSH
jgi:hypothetical protein